MASPSQNELMVHQQISAPTYQIWLKLCFCLFCFVCVLWLWQKLIVCDHYLRNFLFPWWRHQMETFSTLLALCVGNSPVTGEFPSQRPVTRSFDVFFDLRPNKRLNKQSKRWWFETPSRSLWHHSNDWHATCCAAFSNLVQRIVRNYLIFQAMSVPFWLADGPKMTENDKNLQFLTILIDSYLIHLH